MSSEATLPNLPFTAAEVKSLMDEIGGDGHAIYDHEILGKELGIEPSKFNKWVRDHASDGTHKGDIYTKEGVAEHMVGMYGLSLHRGIAAALNLDYPDKYGRGSQARVICSAIYKYLKENTDVYADEAKA